MSKYTDKLLNGETPDHNDWVAYLKEQHSQTPSQTPQVYETPKTAAGLNSYQTLVEAMMQFNRSQRILDLACGDGHLIPYIQAAVGDSAEIVGIDMSEHELAVAKAKGFSRNVKLKCEMASGLTEKSESFDAVLCHMALMLMNPIEPVIREVARVLRPGGIFLAVVGGGAGKSDFFMTANSIINDFLKRSFSKLTQFQGGDARVRTADGIREIFGNSNFKNLEIKEISVTIERSPDEAWLFFKDWYNVTLIPKLEKESLRVAIIEAARAAGEGRSVVTFEHPMRLISATKPAAQT